MGIELLYIWGFCCIIFKMDKENIDEMNLNKVF